MPFGPDRILACPICGAFAKTFDWPWPRLEAARRNGELEGWRQDRALLERALPASIGQAA
jgi:hypothetical protein